jgi:nucleotide-binding universal stress UspA family protein
MLRSILVPLDGSEFGEHALPIAAAVARRSGATLHLAHVHQGKSAAGAAIADRDVYDLLARQTEEDYLADVSARLRARGPLALEPALLARGDVAAGLRDYAERHCIDLVVMATHGRGALARLWLGGVADELARELTRPVLLVRPGEGPPDLDHDVEMRSILVPLDGTALAEKAIGPALEMGKLFDAELTLVRVNAPVLLASWLPEAPYGPSDLGEAAAAQRQEAEIARRYLDGVAARLTDQGARVRVDVVVDALPADGILGEARAAHADLIALQTHGRRGLARFFLGSVADGVVHGGSTPVLLHHCAV